MTDTPIWERLPSDTDKSYEAFCIYRDMGASRSLEKVSKKLDKSVTLLGRWSSDHNWVDRVSAYDTHRAAERSKRKEAKRIQIEDNVLKDYNVMRKAIEKRLKLLQDTNYAGEVYELQNLLGLMKQADDYARRAVGLPDKISESKSELSGALDLTVNKKAEDLTDDELASLITNKGK